LKPKRCRECKAQFVPVRAMQPVCNEYKCKIAYATKAAAKAKKAREQRQRREKREWVEANRSYGYLLEKAQKAVNAYVRVRDHDKACISCGRFNPGIVFGGVFDAGHYRSVGSSASTRFHLLNIWKQCKHCNDSRGLSGNPIEYRKALVLKLGEKRVLQLEHDNAVRKYSKGDLRRIATIFRKRERLYKRLKGL